MRFSVEVAGEGVVTGGKHWSGGSVVVIFRAEDGTRIGQNTVATLKRESQFQPRAREIYLNRKVDNILVALRFLNAKGRFSIRNPELSVLAEFPRYKAAKYLFAGYWTLLAISLVVWLFRSLTIKNFTWVSGWSVLVFLGVLIPGGIVSAVNTGVFSVLPDGIASIIQSLSQMIFGSFDSKAPSAGISKIGHFVVFFIIGVFVGKSFREVGVAYGIALMSVVAIVTESLQILVYGRSTSLQDVYIDLGGGLLGLAFGIVTVVLFERHNKKPNPT